MPASINISAVSASGRRSARQEDAEKYPLDPYTPLPPSEWTVERMRKVKYALAGTVDQVKREIEALHRSAARASSNGSAGSSTRDSCRSDEEMRQMETLRQAHHSGVSVEGGRLIPSLRDSHDSLYGLRWPVGAIGNYGGRGDRQERAGEPFNEPHGVHMAAKNASKVGPRYPHVVVLVGATGDLSRRRLLPGLFHLVSSGFIPGCRIIGVSLDELDAHGLRKIAREALDRILQPQGERGGLGRFLRDP